MPRNSTGESSKKKGGEKRRSNHACQSCRVAKAKCELVTGRPQCRRCFLSSAACVFPPSRRGRIKGSKNRRTLDKLRDEQTLSSWLRAQTQPVLGVETSTTSQSLLTPESGLYGRGNAEAISDVRDSSENNLTAGSQCEIDLDDNVSREASYGSRGTILSPSEPEKILHIPGKLPIERGKNHDVANDAKGLQDPLWAMAGLAERGWDLHGIQGHQSNSVEPPASRTSPGLPVEEARLLSKWKIKDLQEIEKEHSRYYEHGLSGSKCDVAPDLDPIQRGLVTKQRSKDLFEAYFDMINPQWAVLDPTIHTVEYVSARSALLTTTILAVGATALSQLPDSPKWQVTEALRLHAHTQNLKLVVFAAGARSIEIVQAQIILSRWGVSPSSRLDEQRWMHAAMVPRMAAEIGLSLSHRYDEDGCDTAEAEKLRNNNCRTRAFMIINEHRFASFSGRHPMDLAPFELDNNELDTVTHLYWGPSCISLAALYHLFLFDKDVRRRLEQYQSGPGAGLSIDAELEHVKSYTENWIQEWCHTEGKSHLNWHLSHDALSCWLLLVVHLARRRTQLCNASQISHRRQQEQQRLLLGLCTRLFAESLKTPGAVRTTHRAGIFPFAASILLRLGGKRDLVLRTALHMAGEPGKPHVPTFVRQSGTQMLVMLCKTHLSRAPTPMPQAPIGPDHGQPHLVEEELEAGGSQCSQAHEPMLSNTDIHGSQPTEGAIFPSFNLPAFPYVPNPDLPQMQVQESLLLPPSPLGDPAQWGLADLENWIGTTTLSEPLQESGNYAPMQVTSVGLPFDSMAPCRVPLQDPHTEVTWNRDDLSPANTFPTAPGVSTTRGNTANEQREYLLSAVDHLKQLVSLIQ